MQDDDMGIAPNPKDAKNPPKIGPGPGDVSSRQPPGLGSWHQLIAFVGGREFWNQPLLRLEVYHPTPLMGSPQPTTGLQSVLDDSHTPVAHCARPGSRINLSDGS